MTVIPGIIMFAGTPFLPMFLLSKASMYDVKTCKNNNITYQTHGEKVQATQRSCRFPRFETSKGMGCRAGTWCKWIIVTIPVIWVGCI